VAFPWRKATWRLLSASTSSRNDAQSGWECSRANTLRTRTKPLRLPQHGAGLRQRPNLSGSRTLVVCHARRASWSLLAPRKWGRREVYEATQDDSLRR
jgi:hypothetical protein